jgi:multiple sugar transport system permease protein
MKSNTKVKANFGKSSRFKMVLQSDMSVGNKVKLFLKIYGRVLGNIPTYIALIALSVVFIVPFFYMIGHSLMTVNDILNPNIKWLPRAPYLDNYKYAFNSMNYFHYLFRTVGVVAIAVLGQVLSCSFVAYGLARVKFRFSGVIFALVLFMLIVPPQTIIVPSYIMYSKVGWLNTFFPIVVPCFFSMGLNGGLLVFVFRQFFKGMPSELENAALIDGTSIFGAYFRIIFPNAKPAILTTSILSFVWQWNNSFEPSVYFTDVSKGLLTMQLNLLQKNVSSAVSGIDFNAGINMAGTFLTVAPIILVFLAIQGQFMKNMANSGLAN